MSKQLTRRQKQAHRQQEQRRRTMTWAAIGAVALLLISAAIFIAAISGAPAIDAGDPEQLALGEQVYAAQCAACHGANLEGEADWQQPTAEGLLKAPPHDETGHTWHHDDAYLIESVKLGGARLPANVGVSAMPAYAELLSDEEIAAVLAFIKSYWPAEIRAAQAGR